MFTYDLGDGTDLRILEARHAAELLDFVTANRDYLGEWLSWAANMYTLEDAQHFIKRGLARYVEDGLPWVGIWQDDEMAGGILFFPVDARIRATSIGYWLGQKAAGRGLMSRALQPMLSLVFSALCLNRVELIAEVDNVRSRGVADRLGFTLEGVRRGGWVRGDAFVDVAVYSMLAREWQSHAEKST